MARDALSGPKPSGVKGGQFERSIALERAEGETYRASLSSETPVERWFGRETLQHDEDSINMERTERGLVMLYNHDPDRAIGRIQNVRLDGRRLVGDLKFSNSEFGRQVKAQVDEGTLQDMSIRYSIDKYERTEREDEVDYTVTRWTPLEASVVTVPADNSVGIGRSKEEIEMADDDKSKKHGDDSIVVKLEEAKRAMKPDLIKELKEEIRQNQIKIERMFSYPGVANRPGAKELKAAIIENDIDASRANEILVEFLAGNDVYIEANEDGEGKRMAPTVNIVHKGEEVQPMTPKGADRGYRAEAGDDQQDKVMDAAQSALNFRGGLYAPEERKDMERQMGSNPFAGYTLSEMAREIMRSAGHDVGRLNKDQVVGLALREGARAGVPAQGTADFTSLLANTANKALAMGYDEAPEVWDRVVRIGSIADFKQGTRPSLSEAGDLDQIPESGEYKYMTFSDKHEIIQAYSYGKLFSISRYAIINDDLAAFTAIPRKMGRAANRKVGDKVFDIFNNGTTATYTMNEDSTVLFDTSTHANWVTSGADTQLDETGLNAMRTAMATQTDQSGNAYLNIRPAKLVVPVALEYTARDLMENEYYPNASTSQSDLRRNLFRGMAEVVTDARLDANSSTAWFATADPNMFDTIEVAFVNGQSTPYLETRDGWSVDGVEYKVRHEFAVAPLDWRTFWGSDGVS